ncbi:hypothetical protein C7B65_26070 [Phormidesmis priestleyi ULC007]|uniref:Uncharacterized protein n=1 Tax=Phormidesmis priestleyi ULC007 TaxID=1920490 RepID=A0A2T1D2E8_9CYAN|nr:hypothetical protein [Phormidesmis priestleyi]PSB14673.1 hypothetical protein C7B65_26070 [Phormidesmis priestleyi ULC007]
MNQLIPLDIDRELALHRLDNVSETIEELLAGGVTTDDLEDSGVLGDWKSSEEKLQEQRNRKVAGKELLQSLAEPLFGSNESCAEEF